MIPTPENPKTIKKALNWIIFLIVLFTFLHVGGLLRFNVTRIKNARNVDFLMANQNSDVVLIGNSHMYYGISPIVMNGILPQAVTTSLALYPGPMTEYYPYVKELVTSEKRPDVLVMEAYTLMIDSYTFDYSRYAKHNLDMLPDIVKNVNPEKHIPWIFPIYKNHELWKDAHVILQMLAVSQEQLQDTEMLMETRHPSASYYMNRTVMSDEKFERALGAGVLPVTEYNPLVLEMYRDLCKENDVELVLINLPAANQWGTSNDEVAFWADELSIPYYDFNEEIAAVQEYGNVLFVAFDNPVTNLNSHVNTMGAFVSSLALADHISEALDVPLDEDKYAQYQEVILTDITLTLSGDGETYTVIVSPLVTSDEVLYDWRVMGQEDHKSILLERQQKSKELSFTFSADAWEQANYLSLKIFHPVLENMDGYIELRIYP